ncbi:MAG: hypothetical protein JWL83_3848 [Actinomycetia bacterium]|nr:hypothetical protein [Actinomycetes bacterium]
MPADEEGGRKRGVGFLTRLLLVVLAFIGAWVVVGHFWDWAHPWWRYASVASISFTVGGFYGRFRKYEHDEKKRGARA